MTAVAVSSCSREQSLKSPVADGGLGVHRDRCVCVCVCVLVCAGRAGQRGGDKPGPETGLGPFRAPGPAGTLNSKAVLVGAVGRAFYTTSLHRRGCQAAGGPGSGSGSARQWAPRRRGGDKAGPCPAADGTARPEEGHGPARRPRACWRYKSREAIETRYYSD